MVKSFRDFINEQASSAYLATGTKFCFFGSCQVDIKVINKSTGEIVIVKGANAATTEVAYQQAVQQVQEELKAQGIQGVTLPAVEGLEDSGQKK